MIRTGTRSLMLTMTALSWLVLLPLPAGLATEDITSTGISSSAIRVIELPTSDLIYSFSRRGILVSVPSRYGPNGNTVALLNPIDGQVKRSVFVGSEPNKLALSDDGTTLYVGLDGAAAVRVVDMTTFTAGLQFALGFDPFTGPYFPEDMAVVPGAPESVAISRRNLGFSPRHEGVAIYDDGVQRPDETPGHTGSNVIEFSDSASTLYGYNNETTEYGFRTMAVDPEGVTVVQTVDNLITGFYVDFEYDHANDLAYATSGRVIDPAASVLMGTISATGPVEPDSGNGLVYYLTGSAPTLTLKAFDSVTFVPRGSLTINGVSGSPGSLIHWGRSGLAFRSSGDQIFIITPGG